MRLFSATLIIALASIATFGQSGQAPTLRIVTETPNLPSELFYGNIKVKPLRLRPGTNTPITINDADFFVTQNYTDFLSRFPDPEGFNFWQNQITACGSNANCLDVKRIHVSASFFFSIEFQRSGYLVYKMYEGAFGNLPGKPVPVRREDFLRDTRAITDGVIIPKSGWEALLDSNTNSFALAFVQRGSFKAAFPVQMTAQAFVDKLDSNAGLVLSSTDKADLVATLGGTPGDDTKRAATLRKFADNPNLTQRDFNKAFVLMQYFGYLRREPDDAGFDFWLKKLNQFNGDFVQAEMVKAFLTSFEYLERF